jgi:hypothetical protein
MDSALFSQCTRNKGALSTVGHRKRSSLQKCHTKVKHLCHRKSTLIMGFMCNEIYESLAAVSITSPNSMSIIATSCNLVHQVESRLPIDIASFYEETIFVGLCGDLLETRALRSFFLQAGYLNARNTIGYIISCLDYLSFDRAKSGVNDYPIVIL